MKQLLSPALVKQSLASHAWLGLAVGAFMYLVCLSGSFLVFEHELEHWEQADAPERHQVTPEQVQSAYNLLEKQVMAEQNKAETDSEHHHHMFVMLPTAASPNMRVASDDGSYFVNADGSLGDKVDTPWTQLLIDLHLYLHLPKSFGMIVVSILGVMLCGLIISGFLSHPRIFKDAFTLRPKAAPRLSQADWHNRFSVWGAPFHLMIGVTGAFFGLASLFVLIGAQAFYDGDTSKVVPAIYGAEPELEQPLQTAAVGKALAQMPQIAPEAEPFYITVEDVGTEHQYILLGAEHPERLIYAEQYRFDSAGNYLSKVGFSDGEAGRQAIFSVYRIHFGHFGGLLVKLAYVALGLALAVISVSGINIWLAKRRQRDGLNNIWTAIVWGTPLALGLTAVAQLALGGSSKWIFWGALVIAALLCQWVDRPNRSKGLLQLTGALTLLAMVILHAMAFGAYAWKAAPLGINLSFIATAVLLFWRGLAHIGDNRNEMTERTR
ncbi:PepSY-associated TM helix domain-containing protein [Gilvimarinus xylanilyticus]|uniref:PepSY domain-containing protein n=1 Tax=Gilvimarinus xylanilyticus TaxID=2944139 RepID=A0A9X2HYI7_9GAMM|nr:PepSY-associated TM helix domain-containing protein [Gilvimarinus xylanilyticus]MCP8897713.1 PepSY domain-containing protein [Gilvimarinus xylanilyticus]